MLGIILIYFIWKYYSELAVEHNKSKWGFALLGIASYYFGTFMGGLTFGIIDLLIGSNYVESSNIVLNLIVLPFGLLFVCGLYKLLENKWKTQKFPEGGSLDDDLLKSNIKD
jgi:thiamine transporter ThiT